MYFGKKGYKNCPKLKILNSFMVSNGVLMKFSSNEDFLKPRSALTKVIKPKYGGLVVVYFEQQALKKKLHIT